jgi:hypothetical protein
MIDSSPTQNRTPFADQLTVIAIAVIAYSALYICHEIIGHCGMAVVVGTKCKIISSTNIPLATMVTNWKYNLIAVAGCTANFVAAFVCLALLRRWKIAKPATRYFLWLTMSVNLFLASTYIAVAPIIQYGDSYILIRDLPAKLFWRILVAVVGAIMCWFSIRLARVELAMLIGFGGRPAQTVAWKLVIPAYIAGGLVTVSSALFSQLDPRFAQLQAAGGTFGLTAWLLLLPPLIKNSVTTSSYTFALARSMGWILAGVITVLIFVGVLGRGVSL